MTDQSNLLAQLARAKVLAQQRTLVALLTERPAQSKHDQKTEGGDATAMDAG